MPAPDVAIISPYPDSDAGVRSGVAWYTAKLVRALGDAGAQVEVIAQREGRVVDGGARIRRVFRRGPTALASAVRGAAATGAPVVHLQHELFLYGGPSSIPSLGPSLAVLRGLRLGPVVTAHQVVDPSSIDRRFTELHRVAVPPPLARVGVASVQATIERLAAATIVHEHGFARLLPAATFVPIGIDPAATRSKASDRAALGLDGTRLVVLCFGFVAPYKGLETALAAAALAGPQVLVVVAGGEHPRLAGRDAYAAALQQRWGSVARFTGYVPDAQVGAWFSAADVALFAYPRPFSSSGAVAVALSHRTPVLLSAALAASTGAPPELTVSADPPALADRLRALARDRRELTRVAEVSAELAAGRSWSTVAARHLDLYQEASHANRAARRTLRAG